MTDVRYERRGTLGYITFARPEKLNALTDDGVDDFSRCMQEFDADEQAMVGVVSGEGRAFCTGADVEGRLLDSTHAGTASFYRPSFEHSFAQTANWKPLVAAVHGYALGKGLSAALNCDVVVAAEGTRFQLTETSLNVPANLYWALLADRSPDAFVMDVALTGRFWDAAEALRNTMISRVVPPGEHLAVAEEIAASIAAQPPQAVRTIVRLRRARVAELVQRVDAVAPMYRWDLTADFAEAVAAKMDKREPRFTGR